MKIKDYKCKCEHNDFFFADKGNQKGIYCSYCGKWLKWADKDEQNLAMEQDMEQEPFKPMVEIDLYSVIKQKYIEREVLDKIRAEIEKEADTSNRLYGVSEIGLRKALKIIDKYKAESEAE